MAGVHICPVFRWEILGLFIPRRAFEAIFYTESPTLRQWKVTFEPLAFQSDSWRYSFSLSSVAFGELPLDERDVVADQIRIVIAVNTDVVKNKRKDDYHFCVRNRYAWVFSDTLSIPPLEAKHHVTFDVLISLPGQNVVRQGNGNIPIDIHLEKLSKDLAHLFNNPRYFNLELKSSHGWTFPVHSYIIRKRWSNFFTVHPVHTILDGRVEVNISNHVLDLVLRYMYSGILKPRTVFRHPQLRTELFQVVDLYEIHHLYKVIVKVDNLFQQRVTLTDTQKENTAIPMDGLRFGNNPIPLIWYSNSGHKITLEIRFYMNDNVPWFTYTLSSLSQNNLFVYVNLDIMMRRVDGDTRSHAVHGRQYTVRSDAPVVSGRCQFEGSPVAFAEFINGILHTPAGGTEHFIRCSIHASDGSIDNTIQNFYARDVRSRNYAARTKVLGDHMFEILMESIEPDFKLAWPVDIDPDFIDSRPGGTSANPYLPKEYCHLHKSIFPARMPHWKVVIDNVLEGDVVPDEATCSMSREAFCHFVAYIYSGKLFLIPKPCLIEMEDFAIRGGLPNLADLLRLKWSTVRQV